MGSLDRADSLLHMYCDVYADMAAIRRAWMRVESALAR